MRGNAWQITAIISIILVVLLIVPLVIMGRDYQTMNDQTTQARAELATNAQRLATLERENEALKTLIGVIPGVAGIAAPNAAALSLEEIQAQHNEILASAGHAGIRAYASHTEALQALLEDLRQTQGRERAASENLSQLQSRFDDTQNQHTIALGVVQANLAEAIERANAAEVRLATAIRDHERQLADVQALQRRTLSRAEMAERQLTEELRLSRQEVMDTRESNQFFAELLDQVRNPNVEHPAGRIISVDQGAGTAIINVGSADGLRVRTTFSVFHSGITGLTFRTAPAGRDPIYCDACMRDIGRDVSKARVEVMQILGPHQAEVRILDDIITDPIMVGDVIYSPIWRPGQRVRFALPAGMRLPGSSIESGTEAVRRLIEMQGGIVDVYIDEMATDEENIVVGDITDLTNFIVINEAAVRDLHPEVARMHFALIESARNRAVRAITLEDLLHRMGWRNMTPVDTFGSLDFLPEMRVIPQHQGALRQAPGTVSPAFTPDNPAARVNPRDSIPIRPSTNAVSPIFGGNVPPPPSSGGSTSGLFRPRSPRTE